MNLVTATCRRCGAELREGARFCDQCGAPVEAAVASDAGIAATAAEARDSEPLEGEHRPASVMFTDVVGSMDLQESLGPEQWQSLIDRLLEVTAAAVEPLGGSMNQFTGDGWMVLFGVPETLEDHARRACLAALELKQRLAGLKKEWAGEVEVAVRCGVHSGAVIAGSIGAGHRRHQTALGHAVSLAKRIESLAPKGSIAVSEDVAALVAGGFELRDLGMFEVKGASLPQRVYELVGVGAVRSRIDAVAARGFSSFVGRAAELAVLDGALQAASRGEGRIVALVGDAGVGKSRICGEFIRSRLDARTPVSGVSVPSHGASIPLLFALDLLRGFFGVSGADDPRVARERVSSALVALDPALAEDVPLVLDFLGLSSADTPVARIDPDARMQLMIRMSRRLIRGRSERGLAVILLEDLHWIDAASDTLLAELIDAWSTSRTLVLTTFRPEYEPPWLGRESCHQLRLEPLPSGAVGELLDNLLGRDRSCEPVRATIEQRAGGNPFFVEELVRGLVEHGTLAGSAGAYRLVRELDALEIPSTVQAVVLARIDHLPRPHRRVLQTASVIGADISRSLLREIRGSSAEEISAVLDALVEAGFLTEAGAGGEYLFAHPLIAETAYASQLSERRVRAHAATAAAIERLHAQALDEHAALLAHHYEGAGQAVAAAGWHARAAVWAGSTSPDEALRHWRRVAELTDGAGEDGDQRAARLALDARTGILGAAWRQGLPAAEADRVHAEGRRLLGVVNDPAAGLVLEAAYARNLIFTAREREGLQVFRAMLEVAERTDNAPLALNIVSAMSSMLWFTEGGLEVIELTDRAFAMTGGDDRAGAGMISACPVAQCEFVRMFAFGDLGRLDEARRSRERAITLALEHGEPQTAMVALAAPVFLALRLVPAERQLADAERALELSHPLGGGFPRAGALAARSIAACLLGRPGSAVEDLTESLAISGRRNVGLFNQPLYFRFLAYAHLSQGNTAAALPAAQEAVGLAAARGLRSVEVGAQEMLARVLAADGRHDESARALERAMSLAQQIGARAWEPVLELTADALARGAGHDRPGARAAAARKRLAALGGEPVLPVPAVGVGLRGAGAQPA